jgi:hydroxymethylpyrimidine/phosphomethylpyrimidine kinase
MMGTTAADAIVRRPCVLVIAGIDPSGGAGLYADVQAIAAMGAHALPVVSVLTVQDHNQVFAITPLAPEQILAQIEAVLASIKIAAIKIGIVGTRRNAEAIAHLLKSLVAHQPDLPIVLDPVLASGHGDRLTTEDPIEVIKPIISYATLITPNLPEAALLANGSRDMAIQAASLFQQGAKNILIKGGHGTDAIIGNHWFSNDGTTRSWQWPRLPGDYHGSGCTLASAIAGLLASGINMADAIDRGQTYCQQTLDNAFAIGAGQRIPNRTLNTQAFDFKREPV